MTVYRTFGAGGDHANIQALWEYLQGVDPLADDYEFMQVGNCTETGWPATPHVTFNSHTVKIYCPFADSHQGDPTKGYVVTITSGISLRMRGNTPTIADILILDGLYFNRTDNINNNLIYAGSWVAGSGMTLRFRNLILKSTSTAAQGGRGIRGAQPQDVWEVTNCKFKLFNQGFNDQLAVTGGGSKVIEHCSFDECNEGIGCGGTWTIRNTVAINCATQGWGNCNNCHIWNSADDDGSLTTSRGEMIDCRQNITPADEFKSQAFTSPDWLKLNDGTVT